MSLRLYCESYAASNLNSYATTVDDYRELVYASEGVIPYRTIHILNSGSEMEYDLCCSVIRPKSNRRFVADIYAREHHILRSIKWYFSLIPSD